METHLAPFIKDTPAGDEAERILRRCVHCGMCTATCPTYQLLGDELDGPRGRIYMIKQVLEGADPGVTTQLHLDRCLTCRSCETTCPSGVEYGRLLDIGRSVVAQKSSRPFAQQLIRRLLRLVIPFRNRFTPLLRLGQGMRPVLPGRVKTMVPVKRRAGAWPAPRHARTMLVLDGCVQPAIAPNINAATAQVLDRLGISLLAADDGCCGAVSHHLDETEEAKQFIRRNIDAWWPFIEQGAEAIVMTASGCGAMVKEYGHLLKDDQNYGDKAARVAALTKDISEVLAAQDLVALKLSTRPRVAFHAPCTLQHGQRIRGVVEKILADVGCELTEVPDAHLCCGSAGTYSILQPEISGRLKTDKLDALQSGDPECIATANIGCLTQLESGAKVPVRHWIELLAAG